MAKEARIKVLVVEPQKQPYVKQIENSLEAMQSVVGGFIESHPADLTGADPDVDLIVNEEGKLTGLPFNRELRGLDGEVYDIVAGTFFVSRKDDEGESISLTEGDIKKYALKFELLWAEGTRVRAVSQITEGGETPGDRAAEFPARGYIHAEPGEVGVIEHVEEATNAPTVRFERTGTATVVGPQEVEVVG